MDSGISYYPSAKIILFVTKILVNIILSDIFGAVKPVP
jgi:hypothetical protein